ncbi:unnamed protein product [Durusdinium trenchii]|uniref:Phospholipid scramblase n=1 Tax=Durusdinium trenchii TaxID=1381693 RepID=A0ABP0K243_9DINO
MSADSKANHRHRRGGRDQQFGRRDLAIWSGEDVCEPRPSGGRRPRVALDGEDDGEGRRIEGNHVTAGSLESLRWATYDAATRTATATGFGGWYQPWYTGSWSEPAGDPIWCFLLWLARVGNATYEFQFSEDFQQAEIIPKGNLGVFCCCCCPCIPGWAPIPSCITRNYMVQADSSVKGDHWERFQGNCGRTPSLYYEIYTVYTIDGKETQWTKLAKEQTSAQVMMTI